MHVIAVNLFSSSFSILFFSPLLYLWISNVSSKPVFKSRMRFDVNCLKKLIVLKQVNSRAFWVIPKTYFVVLNGLKAVLNSANYFIVYFCL